jgi:hypothetical protein
VEKAEMSSSAIRKRQVVLLKRLAKQTGGRIDTKLALSEIAPTLDIGIYGGLHGDSYRFVDKTDRKFEGGSDLAYDYTALSDEGLIEITHLRYGTDSCGGPVSKDPALKGTHDGFEALADYEKAWLAKAIEKEPITFLKIIITVLVGIGGWLIGRYVTPLEPRGSLPIAKVESPKDSAQTNAVPKP